jgi:hypothetical protein
MYIDQIISTMKSKHISPRKITEQMFEISSSSLKIPMTIPICTNKGIDIIIALINFIQFIYSTAFHYLNSI